MLRKGRSKIRGYTIFLRLEVERSCIVIKIYLEVFNVLVSIQPLIAVKIHFSTLRLLRKVI